MKDYLSKLPQETQDLISLAGKTAAEKGMSAYLVGGFVRDLILGVNNLDVDIVVEGEGIIFAEDLAKALKAKLIRHKRFGTATIIIDHSLKLDIATARKEFYPAPAHLPVVESASLKDDHFRRDFTINAMAISINPNSFGELIDYFGGKDDLKEKKVRILHSLSFMDDPTRILRAVRFEQRYDFKIERTTLTSLRKAVCSGILEKIEPQRIRDELILILKEESAIRQIRRLYQLTSFRFFCPRFTITFAKSRLLKSCAEEIRWFNLHCPLKRKLDAWLIFFMALTDNLTIRQVEALCRRFALRKGEERRILTFKNIKRNFILRLSKEKAMPSEIFSSLEPLSYEAILLIQAKYKNRFLKKHISDFLLKHHGVKISLRGEDLRALGIEPGPQYQKIFSALIKAKLDGKVHGKEDELKLVKGITGKG